MLLVVRHGRTEANRSGLLLGRLDPELDEEGRRQAEAMAAAIGSFDRVVSSPLARSMETARFLSDRVDVDDRWIELDYGELDGVPTRDVPAELWRAWRSDPAFAPPGGESLQDLGGRVSDACRALADEAADHDVVVVTHVSPIKAALAWALGVGDEVAWRLYVAPASISRIGFSGNAPVVHSFNEVTHLAR